MSPDFIKRKVLLLGDASVGKTSLIRRFVVDKFSDDYITTIGTKVTKRDLRLELGNRTVDLSLMIWDVLGQKGYKGIQESAFRGARGVLLVYDLTRPETRESLGEYWIPRVRSVAGAVPMLIVGNKVDLIPSKAKATEEVAEAGKAHGMPPFVSSAKTGENVEAAFLAIGKLDQAETFPVRQITPTMLHVIHIDNAHLLGFSNQLIENLRAIGRQDLADGLAKLNDAYVRRSRWEKDLGWRGALRRFDKKYLGGFLIRASRVVDRLAGRSA